MPEHTTSPFQSTSNLTPSTTTSTSSNSHPKLTRLASKPLKLAASTLKPLVNSVTPSRVSTPGPSTTAGLGMGPGGEPTINSTSHHIEGEPRRRGRMGRRKRHVHAEGMTAAQLALAGKMPRKPLEGEDPAAILRVRVVKGEKLVAKDRNGVSDPFVTLVVPPSGRHSTPVIKKELNPIFPPDQSTFDFPLYLSLAGVVGGRGIEAVVWDKDLMRKEYMGEVAIPCLDWFVEGDVKLWEDNLPLVTRRLLSTRRKNEVSGTISFQIGFVSPRDAADQEDALKKVKRIYGAFVDQAGVGNGLIGVLGVPATEGIGTVKLRSNDEPVKSKQAKSPFALLRHSTSAATAPLTVGQHSDSTLIDGDSDDDDLSDDGLSSSSSDDEFEDALEDDVRESPNEMDHINNAMYNTTVSVPGPKPSDNVPKTAGLVPPNKKEPARQSSLPDYFDKPHLAHAESESTIGSAYDTPSGGVTPGGGPTGRRKMFRKKKERTTSTKSSSKKSKDFNFDARQGKEVLGIVIMEIKGAEDLPRLKSSLRVTFDMDPFVVVSFGKKVFRTRVIRHSLNPTWDEKLLFHVRRHEAAFTTQFTVLDWDKVSGNDLVGNCTLPLSELVADAPKPDPETGLYAEGEDGKHEMKQFTIPLEVDKNQPWESKYSPKLTIRAKYEPYDALRQRFWRQYMQQYDADDTNTMSYTELTAMLDSLGSTLTKQTIEGYFSNFGKDADKDELTFEEVVKCLEGEVTKDRSQKAKVSPKGEGIATGSVTPNIQPQPAAQGLSMAGPQGNISSPVDAQELAEQIIKSQPRQPQPDVQPGNQRLLSNENVPSVKVERSATVYDEPVGAPVEESGMLTPASATSDMEIDEPNDDRERVINIRTCPLCHRSRLGKRSEQDIVTHLAICASSDWNRIDKIVTSNYVTSSQAQRKFFTKLINKVAVGAYSLGANSANILVQDRITGQLQEEKMAVYVRLGIRVLYKGAKGRMEGARARKLLKSLSVKQGIKYDSPASALDIPAFIAFHKLPIDEILDPLDSFKTFNEFFYRKLKPSARPVESPGDEGRLVSCADCRMMAFETVNEATNIWIKGREFTVGRLLGPNYKDVAERFEGGALGIFRLAPQDYHRFHSPVKGTVGKMTLIDGEYYTVNPQAIRTSLDVYGENVRKIVPIQSEEFGLVMTVWVGAMMVGSILTTVVEGQQVERADELGYFAFGGSTIVCLFEKGALQWDDDLVQNGRASIETLVRMGMGLGRSTKV